MNFTVQFSTAANEDLQRIFDFLIQRELESPTGDLDIPEKSTSCHACRHCTFKTSPSSSVRFGISEKTTTIENLSIRHRVSHSISCDNPVS
jgi:hypothetical protein